MSSFDWQVSCGLGADQLGGDEAIRLVEDERQGTQELGALAEHSRNDLQVFDRARDRVAANGFAQRLEQHFSYRAEVAADDHALRVEDVAEIRDGKPDRAPGVADQSLSRLILRRGELEQAPGGDLLAPARAQQVRDRAG
jgi:hypothetical protein